MSQQFKALPIQQPYASALMRGDKLFETRSWRPGKVEQFVIHAGRTFITSAQAILKRHLSDWPDDIRLPRGAVLGIVRVVDVYRVSDLLYDLDELESEIGNWQTGYAWEIEVIKIFDTPIPARGQQGFRNITLPPNLTDIHRPQIHMD